MTKILLAGDTHCSRRQIDYLYERAQQWNCDMIIQLGDFGYFPQDANGILFLSQAGFLATTRKIPLWFIDGNHEDYDSLHANYGTRGDSPTELLPNVFYIPRGCSFTLDDVKFITLGGAFSVDRDWRVEAEAVRGQYRSLLWYPDELTSEADVDKAIANGQGAQVMLTHDAPACVDITKLTHMRLTPELEAESRENRERVQRAVDSIRPSRLYGGHFHTNHTVYIDGTRIEILNCDNTGKLSWTILDTADLKVDI